MCGSIKSTYERSQGGHISTSYVATIIAVLNINEYFMKYMINRQLHAFECNLGIIALGNG